MHTKVNCTSKASVSHGRNVGDFWGGEPTLKKILFFYACLCIIVNNNNLFGKCQDDLFLYYGYKMNCFDVTIINIDCKCPSQLYWRYVYVHHIMVRSIKRCYAQYESPTTTTAPPPLPPTTTKDEHKAKAHNLIYSTTWSQTTPTIFMTVYHSPPATQISTSRSWKILVQ